MFSFKFIHGDRNQVLEDKKSIVITASLARRLFGAMDDVVGNMVELEHNKQFQFQINPNKPGSPPVPSFLREEMNLHAKVCERARWRCEAHNLSRFTASVSL